MSYQLKAIRLDGSNVTLTVGKPVNLKKSDLKVRVAKFDHDLQPVHLCDLGKPVGAVQPCDVSIETFAELRRPNDHNETIAPLTWFPKMYLDWARY